MSKELNDSSIEIITSLPDADYMNTVNASTGKISKITGANVKNSITGGVLIYAAQLTQSSTGAPTAAGTTNNLGTTLTLARTTNGQYTATAGAAIFTSKTIVFIQNVFGTRIATAQVTSSTVISIKTYNAGTFSGEDDSLLDSSFKIEIYP